MKKHTKVTKKKTAAAASKTKHPAPAKLKAPKALPKAKADKATAPAAVAKAPEPKAKLRRLPKDEVTKYRKLLLDLRDHLIDGVNFLASDNLKRSARETTGELSGYSMHMADAGTDNYDREFALSLVSNEQEALYEIEEALKRLEASTYGVCELCEQPIRRERMEAIPFTRFCVGCQATVEKEKRHPSQPGALFSEPEDEEGEGDDAEES